MNERRETGENIVVLIDADNTDVDKIGNILEELSKEGKLVVKRAYGDFFNDNLKKWREKAKECRIKLELAPNYVRKKNTTDITLIVDAMELFHTGLYDTFVIVSSDSDFTSFATRMREKCVRVIGVGEKKTPLSLVDACDKFLYMEDILTEEERKTEERKAKVPCEVHQLLVEVWQKYKKEDGFAFTSTAGSYIKDSLSENFDADYYGYHHLFYLLKDFPEKYEIQSKSGKGFQHNRYRCKDKEEE